MTLADRLERFFTENPNVFVDGKDLAGVAGTYAWRTRLSEVRQRFKARQRRTVHQESPAPVPQFRAGGALCIGAVEDTRVSGGAEARAARIARRISERRGQQVVPAGDTGRQRRLAGLEQPLQLGLFIQRIDQPVFFL